MELSTVLKEIQDADTMVVYGAGIVATGVYTVLKQIYGIKTDAFLITDEAGNPQNLDGVPVVHVGKYGNREALVLVATPQVHFEDIGRELLRYGYDHVLYMDEKLENELLRRFFGLTDKFPLLQNESTKEGKKSFRIYMAKSHVDKPLTVPLELPEWMMPIQAGAELTKDRIADLLDNSGENISRKNRDYCELTVTYWIWKHAAEHYVGICHYRRVFDIGEAEVQTIRQGNVDAVLVYPSIHYPSAMDQHLRYLDPIEWEILWQAIAIVSPGQLQEMKNILKESYFYNYNMVIAKKNVFDSYCAWMFEVLKVCGELFAERGITGRKRYIGYMGETLTTLYFRYHRNRYSILHTGKIWVH